jgi:general secretion pathway protein E
MNALPQAGHLQPPAANAAHGAVGEPDFSAWGPARASRHQAVVLRADDGQLWLATAEAPPAALVQAAEAAVQAPLRWAPTTGAQLADWLRLGEQAYRALGALPGASGMASGTTAADGTPDLSQAALQGDTSPAVRWLDALLYDALQDGASDIHLENGTQGALLRLRIDGVLLPVQRIASTALAEQVVSRLKVMAELDIGERRLPQDGRFKLRLHGREIDFRLSILPSTHGEDAVVRVLDRATLEQAGGGQLSLAGLGFTPALRQALLGVARRPHGMLLVTGPTGSGKTTTLYAAMAETLTPQEKFITIEDPVEYQLPGVVQIPVNDRKGLGFARGLRSILRHDPDRVMVGEIRDAETAQIAVQAALTGHLVFSTVHANSALDVVGRFMHLGLDLHNLVAALQAVLAQRLMRQRCTACGGVGCTHCRHTGYRGRRAVAEWLPMDDGLRDLIVARAPLSTLKQAVRERGLANLREAAQAAVDQGWTTAEELQRVTADD